MSIGALPVRTRLTVWFVLVLAAILLLFVGGTSAVLYWQLFNQLTRFAVQDVENVEGLLFFAPDGRLSLNENYHNHEQSRLIQERLLEVVSPSGTLLYRNERLGGDRLGGAPFAGEGVNSYSERSASLAGVGRILLVSRRHSMRDVPIVIRLGYSQDAIRTRVEEFLVASAVALPFLLAVAALFGYQLAGRALSPLEQMATRAEQITAERLNQRLPVQNPNDELGHLARVINNVLDRLELSFQQLRRFTSDASHELRTPLAAIRSVGEVGMQDGKHAADYQDTIGSMLEEVGRLTKLVESLLEISRTDSGQVKPNLTTFSPLDLAKEVAGFVEVLAEERRQKLLVSGEANLVIKGDRSLLRQAFINVLHNAVKYSPVGGEVSISISAADSMALVKIADSGPGIAPEHRLKIFDRFYRIDTGRTRDAGGTGLGLSIAKWAVEAQNGRIWVEGADSGATFVIELPKA
jgi:heavy metal sensor kinase